MGYTKALDVFVSLSCLYAGSYIRRAAAHQHALAKQSDGEVPAYFDEVDT